MQKFIKIGKIVSFRGLDGTMKLLTDNTDNNFKNLKKIFINNNEYTVKKLSKVKNFIFLSLCEITSINEAEKLKNLLVYVDRDNIALDKNEYFICDVLNMKVYDSENKYLGIVDDITNYGAQDVYTIKNGKNEITFCLVEDLFDKVDLEKNILILNKQKLDEVMV